MVRDHFGAGSSWWTHRGTALQLKARASVKSPPKAGAGGLSLETLLDFDWELALGEDKITRAEELRLQLADEIVRGALPPGASLDETDIARRFKVSRTPVREALRQLVASG